MITVATVRRNMCGLTPSMPASPRTLRSWRLTLAVVSGVPSRLRNTPVDRVAVDHLVPHREAERKPEHGLGPLGAGVRLLAKLLEQGIAPGDADLAQGVAAEGRKHEPVHVTLVVEPGRRRDPGLQVEVGQPVLDQRRERLSGVRVVSTGWKALRSASRAQAPASSYSCPVGVRPLPSEPEATGTNGAGALLSGAAHLSM